MSELTVRHLSKHFGGVKAVEDASFSARAGECTTVIGPNGAGKSTVIGLISGALRSDGGQVFLDDNNLTNRPELQLARLGILRTFQQGGEFGRLTAFENVLLGARLSQPESIWEALAGRRRWSRREAPLAARALALLDGFGLGDKADLPAGTLSGGERRLVEMARVLAAGARVVLFDEPTAGVHDVMIGRLERHIREVAESGVIVIVVEHELGLVDRISNRIVVMASGSVLRVGSSLEELRADADVVAAYFGRSRVEQ